MPQTAGTARCQACAWAMAGRSAGLAGPCLLLSNRLSQMAGTGHSKFSDRPTQVRPNGAFDMDSQMSGFVTIISSLPVDRRLFRPHQGRSQKFVLGRYKILILIGRGSAKRKV